MIYLDTSVALAQLLAEDRAPDASLWDEPLVSSRLLEYEVWNRVHARGLTESHGEAASLLLGSVALLALAPQVVARALQPFPVPVRTLDALHLSSIEFLRQQGIEAALATYDDRLSEAASALGLPIHEP